MLQISRRKATYVRLFHLLRTAAQSMIRANPTRLCGSVCKRANGLAYTQGKAWQPPWSRFRLSPPGPSHPHSLFRVAATRYALDPRPHPKSNGPPTFRLPSCTTHHARTQRANACLHAASIWFPTCSSLSQYAPGSEHVPLALDVRQVQRRRRLDLTASGRVPGALAVEAEGGVGRHVHQPGRAELLHPRRCACATNASCRSASFHQASSKPQRGSRCKCVCAACASARPRFCTGVNGVAAGHHRRPAAQIRSETYLQYCHTGYTACFRMSG